MPILDNVTINQPVADLTALAAIPTGALVIGAQVYVIAETNTYYWNGASWSAGAGPGAPANATYILQTADGSLPNAQNLGSLATGIVKSTATTGVVSIASDGTDYYGPASITINQAPGSLNLYVGSGAPLPSNGYSNTSLGVNALMSADMGADYNVAIGSGALTAIVSSTRNVAIGQGAMGNSSSGDSCVAIGPSALVNGDGMSNIAIGVAALESPPTGCSHNIAIGQSALQGLNTTPGNNVAVGILSGFSQPYVELCTFIGYQADASGGYVNSGAFGANTIVSASNSINLGNGCNVGVNQVAPVSSMHLSNVSSICALTLDDTASVPTGTSTTGKIYNKSSALYYMDPSSVIQPLTGNLITVSLTDILYSSINSAPVLIIPAITNGNVFPIKVTIWVQTAITGANLILQSAVDPEAILTWTTASLVLNAIIDETTGSAGAGYWSGFNNNAIHLTSSGTLLTGKINILVQYLIKD